MHWQSDGKYLCVKVDRYTKTKKSTFVNFELFRVKEKDIPIELLDIKEQVHAFAWEPSGDRFAIIHGENANKPDVSFYTLTEKQLKNLSKCIVIMLVFAHNISPKKQSRKDPPMPCSGHQPVTLSSLLVCVT